MAKKQSVEEELVLVRWRKKLAERALSGIMPFVRGHVTVKDLTDEEEWWQDKEYHSWGDPSNGDGQYYTTIHHRMELPSPKFHTEVTQTAIVTRTDDHEVVRVILVVDKKTVVINY